MNEQQPIGLAKANLSEEETAAVLAVLRAVSRQEPLHSADDRPRAGGWSSYYRGVRSQLVYGRDAWRTYHQR
ncbi:acyl-CoA carboxylase subunit epsilon [Tessaracoccus caeni]|uniref:acyl-CoA carboxylase subunit epsilon n=1 Tax=Tessaracoccus caeni TaxID=3031239 RepID=UPI0023D9EFB9|nr:acyl-CoA carboxylase subunit epsilon [Tessaracoccus caeni]MDF1488905.1 acyl-CoA carboxylase subunit epsilon [Tessaracoccus caeni]